MTHSFRPDSQPGIPPTESTVSPQAQPIAPTKRLPGWRLWLPLLIQVGLIAFVPAQDAYTYATGRLVTLKTMPVDPYDLLRGYSQTLGYEIGDFNRLRQLPGGDRFDRRIEGAFYIVLQQPSTNTTPPAPWQAVRISSDRPTDLNANQIALRGRYDRGQITYGLERFYMPEDQRNQINEDFMKVRGQTVTQAKVDDRGNAVLVNLWLRDRALQF